MRQSASHYLPLIFAALLSLPVAARDGPRADEERRCSGPVYAGSELSREAKVVSVPEPGMTEEARRKNVRGHVRLRVVLCHTGRVTDVEVLKGLPYGMTEEAVEAARRIKFVPGEKGGRPASQRAQFTYQFTVF